MCNDNDRLYRNTTMSFIRVTWLNSRPIQFLYKSEGRNFKKGDSHLETSPLKPSLNSKHRLQAQPITGRPNFDDINTILNGPRVV